MELKTAEKVLQIFNEIDTVKMQIERFNNTKEFCEIEFRGENGNERKFSFTVSQKNELRQKLRTLVADELQERLENLISELKEL